MVDNNENWGKHKPADFNKYHSPCSPPSSLFLTHKPLKLLLIMPCISTFEFTTIKLYLFSWYLIYLLNNSLALKVSVFPKTNIPNLHLLRATFNLFLSFMCPTLPLLFELTVDIIMISFYWPWKESIVLIFMLSAM